MKPRTLPPSAIKPAPNESGFTLIEILVAVVVLSLGLLGLAGLQVSSLNNNQTAYYRGIASQQAYDMADRMRANLTGVSAGNYDNLNSGTPTSQACFAAACTAAQLATSDYFQWVTASQRLLPNGAGRINCVVFPPAVTCATPRVFDITVTWNEKGAITNATQSFVTRFAP
jgi:type IV pilus assembly protein PilV